VPRVDLTGKIFGRLKVLEYVGNNKWGVSLWRCRCNCAAKTEKLFLGGNLTNNSHTQSCGCILREKEHGPKWVDLTGKTFGRWTVLEFAGIDKHGKNSLWKVRCSCKDHTEKTIPACDLNSLHCQSCGCIQHEREYWVDHTGQRRGRLTFIRATRIKNLAGQMLWNVKCDCGTQFVTRWGRARSCGCSRIDGGKESIKTAARADALPPIASCFKTMGEAFDYIMKEE
jgi:hypothetical protein